MMNDNCPNTLNEIGEVVQTAGLTGDFSSENGERREVNARARKRAD